MLRSCWKLLICQPPIILQVSGSSQSHVCASSSVQYRYSPVSLLSTFSLILYVVLPSLCPPAGGPSSFSAILDLPLTNKYWRAFPPHDLSPSPRLNGDPSIIANQLNQQ